MNYGEMETTALGKLVSERTGVECKSRNKPALIRKLEKMDAEAKPADAMGMERVLRRYESHGVAVIHPDGSVTEMERGASAAEAREVLAAKTAKRARKPRPAAAKRAIHSDPALHAAALAAVRKAMSRKNPPALRELCAELEDKGIKTPWGRKTWWPSSIQSLLRQMEGK